MRSFNRNLLYPFNLHLIIATVCLAALVSSCVTTKKTTYLQDYKKSEYPDEYVPPETYLIQPNDNLYVRVSTPDPTISEIFNAMPGTTTMGGGGEMTQLISYPVHLDGTIVMPYIGVIEVSGKTLSEARATIEEELVGYVSDASVTVRLVNNYVSILGDVNAPGMYPIYKDRLNIYQALAMAGDVSLYGNRYKLKVVRQTPKESVIKEFNLTDENIVDSEFYYVMPNDVIYVKPLKGKYLGLSESRISFFLSLMTTAISTYILIQNYFLLQQPR